MNELKNEALRKSRKGKFLIVQFTHATSCSSVSCDKSMYKRKHKRK